MAQVAYTRKWLVDTLRRIGLTQAADDALRDMPEQFDLKQLEEFGERHDISRDVLADAFGVSPQEGKARLSMKKALAGEKGPGRGPTDPGVTALLLAGVPSTSSTQRLIGLPRTLSDWRRS